MSYKCDDFKPSLRGTWTATLPQEFFYRPEHCEPKCGTLCCSNPCCGKPCCPCEKEEPVEEHHECSKKECCCVKIESSTGSAGPLPPTLLVAPINVVSTGINTCCVGESDNLINFSTTVNVPAPGVGAAVLLIFQLVRASCVGSAVPVGSTYTFAITVVAATALSQNFSFSYMDDDVAPGTYTYTVQLAPGTTAVASGATLTNAVLTVTAVRDD